MGSKISIIVILLVMILTAGALIEVPEKSETDQTPSELKTYEDLLRDRETNRTPLEFENYTVETPPYLGEIQPVDFTTNPFAQNYKDIIERGVEAAKVNYAGHYSIVTWSCGESCQNSAIVDVRTGEIHSYGIISEVGLAFSKESTLLVINPKDTTDDNTVVSDYYSMEGGELVFLAKEVPSQGVLNDCIKALLNARNTITNEIAEFTTPCSVPFGWEVISNTQ